MDLAVDYIKVLQIITFNFLIDFTRELRNKFFKGDEKSSRRKRFKEYLGRLPVSLVRNMKYLKFQIEGVSVCKSFFKVGI